MNLSPSDKVYAGAILILAICGAASVFLPMGQLQQIMPQQELPASKPVLALANAAIMLIIYGGLGYLGVLLSRKVGIADVWDTRVTNKQRFALPLLLGVAIGVFVIAADEIFRQFHTLGRFPHPPFPTSIVASLAAGISEELLFRLFFISLWVWLISNVILRKQKLNQVFWVVTTFSALTFAAGHLFPLVFVLGLESIGDLPAAVITEVILLNGVITFFCAYYFRKYGFLAAVGIHFWTDIVWHVMWGPVAALMR